MEMNVSFSEGLCIAHKLENGEGVQSLIEHLQHTAELAGEFGRYAGIEKLAYQCGLYHDMGKYSDTFQRYIRGNFHGRVDHSTAGAQLFMKSGELLQAFCIAGHHAGLPDFGNKMDPESEPTLCGRYRRSVPCCSRYHEELPDPDKLDYGPLQDRFGSGIQTMLLIRMLFSCLVDADFLDTEEYMKKGKIRRGDFDSLATLRILFFKELKKQGYMDPKNELNGERKKILDRCIAQAAQSPGLFTLTVPTGGGKTVSSMAFALKHAARYGKCRIIYVIPYTSIIEQTADIFRRFLGERNVVEHHMNAVYDDTELHPDPKKLASENWDAPVIVTTNVQFFESLFSNRTSRCRKLHNIAGSVIVFDEAQMFPLPYLKPALQSIQGLLTYYGCTAVFCSATQPHLDRFFQNTPIPVREIMENISGVYDFFRRVTFHFLGLVEYDEVAERMMSMKQVLCVMLTKHEAQELYERIKGPDCFYLSTNLCPVHRSQVIRQVKERLAAGLPCRVVSTTVISVGVDIDFPTVFLEQSGLDSLIQGAGRCNREGKRPVHTSGVYVFKTDAVADSRFMRQERQVTDLVGKRHPDVSNPEAIEDYFDSLYLAKDQSLDQKNIIRLSELLAFVSVNDQVQLIGDASKTVLIPFNEEAMEIIRQLRIGIRTRALMRAAGRYAVNVRFASSPHQKRQAFEQLRDRGQIELLDMQMAVLTDDSAYDRDKRGLLYEEEEGSGIMI
ncbi:CRISPR-associated endonuclease Cas3'' [Megasphaera cerevisiae]|uniref:CRISPR-associated endonuclease Cas3'' n=1 Tax=Megasphaera cerevisiae TaxID=39029 RepID=UPI0009F878F1|nr:CRISPR-associated endonuclease Cas3'' [Megasphaera cerevisiae]